MITPEDFPGVDEDAARRIIVAARSIAPCIDVFPDESEEKKNALAILRGVAAEAPAAGSRRVRAQRIGSASVDYWDANTWRAEDRAALRSLCPAATASGAPRGSFPTDRPLAKLWPEHYA
ncbi:hypothetical protein AB6V29_01465 [Microbacterium sp. 20-116]|uniref:hypothetical protein n=1 Tax=Microbacterium sp. 20-116 TaxID=3239883 RepID=UPI0034E1F3F0